MKVSGLCKSMMPWHMCYGRRNQKIYCTNPRNPDIQGLICGEKAPVLKMKLNRWADPPPAIWVATTKSLKNNWTLKGIHHFRASGDYDDDSTNPSTKVHKLTGLLKWVLVLFSATFLMIKRCILTKDTNNNMAYWNVLKTCKVEDLGKMAFEDEIKNRFKMMYMPNWFSIDLQTGILTITLDKSDHFAAWVSAKQCQLHQPWRVTSNTELRRTFTPGTPIIEHMWIQWMKKKMK